MAQQSFSPAPSYKNTLSLKSTYLVDFQLGWSCVTDSHVVVCFDDGKYHFDITVEDGTGIVQGFALYNVPRRSGITSRKDHDSKELVYHAAHKYRLDPNLAETLGTDASYDVLLQKAVKFVADGNVDEENNELHQFLSEIIGIAQQLAKGYGTDAQRQIMLQTETLKLSFDIYRMFFLPHVDQHGNYCRVVPEPVEMDAETAKLFAIPEPTKHTASPADA